MRYQTWLITGTSSGFGLCLAKELLSRGYQVVATARRPDVLSELTELYGSQVCVAKLDVCSKVDIEAAVLAGVERFGSIDAVVNNAGFGVFGGIEEVSIDEARRQFETNFFGALNVIHAVVDGMRVRRHGLIMNISSIAGFSSFPGSGIYGASKFALEAVSESLSKELKMLGVRTIIVEPGAFRTDFLGSNFTSHQTQLDDYRESVGEVLDYFAQLQADGDPLKAAKAMVDVAEQDDPPMRLLLGDDAWHFAMEKMESLRTDFERNKDVTLSMKFD